MVTRKYVGDYRLEDVTDEKGRHRTVAVYEGEYYAFTDPQTDGRMAGIGSLVCLAVWILGLFTDPLVFRTVYVMVPYAFCCIPLYFLCSGGMTAWIGHRPFLHAQADRINSRIPAGTLVLLLLGGIALIGTLIRALTGGTEGMGIREYLFCVADILLLAVSGFIFRKRKAWRTEKTEN